MKTTFGDEVKKFDVVNVKLKESDSISVANVLSVDDATNMIKLDLIPNGLVEVNINDIHYIDLI